MGNVKYLLLFILLYGSGETYAQTRSSAEDLQDESTLKALFIYNFTKYIEWPTTKANAPFIIAVYGNSPVKDRLTAMLKGRKVYTHPIEIRSYDASDTSGVQIIYIPSQHGIKSSLVNDKKSNNGMLIITEVSGNVQNRAGINLITKEDKLRFEVNQSALRKAGLKISDQLIELAIVID